MITTAALKNGFTGGVIVDYPNSKKAKKYYLFLTAGFSDSIYAEAKSVVMPEALDDSDEDD
jgi:18S rRNA (guanine1575-N7)-methyltransferase